MKLLGIITLIALIILAVAIGPIFTIWSVNFLFGTALVVNLPTWASIVWLEFVAAAVIRGPFSTRKVKIVD